MVIKIIKTGYEIIQSQYNYRFIVEKLEKEKFLVLPSGLDKLEEMLKKEVLPGEQLYCTPEYLGVEVVKIISSVFLGSHVSFV